MTRRPNRMITMQDMRRVDFCAAGVEAFFKREGLDYTAFLQEGIAAERLAAIDSVFVRKCLTAAATADNRTEQGDDNGR